MALCLVVAAGLAIKRPDTPAALRMRADAEAQVGHWDRALALWRRVNHTPSANAASYRAEARACLALGRAGQAEAALIRASTLDPGSPEPWLTRLEIARMEDRPLDAIAITEAATTVVPSSARRLFAQALTLALLAETPEELARETLRRWLTSDPGDLDALAALDRRRSFNPDPDDPPIGERIGRLEQILGEHPEHTGVREALVLALAEQGDSDRGRAVLDNWPAPLRDARYERLAGRWALDYDKAPDQAVDHFRKALRDLPFDWKTHYRLARALQAAGQTEAARREAVEVSRLRERLDPVRLGRQLDKSMHHLDEPASRRSLAELCDAVGLERLASVWRLDAEAPEPPSTGTNSATEFPFRLPRVPPARRR
jgi:tetratricopeptide (TPR) repeat protein